MLIIEEKIMKRYFIFSLLSISAGLYTHNLFPVILFGIVFSYIISKFSVKKNIHFLFTRQILGIVLVLLLAFVSYIPWLNIVFSQINMMNKSFWLTFNWVNSPAVSIIQLVVNYMPNWDLNNIRIVDIASTILGIFSILILIFNLKSIIKNSKIRTLLIVFVTIFLLYYVLSFNQPILYIRYISYLSVAFIILMTVGLSRMKKIFLNLFIASLVVFNLFFAFPSKADNLYITPVVNYINDLNTNNKQIVNQDIFTYFGFEYYSGGKYSSYIYDKYSLTPSYTGTAVVDKDRFLKSVSSLNTNRLYIVTQYDIYKELETDLKDNNYSQISRTDFEQNLHVYEFSR